MTPTQQNILIFLAGRTDAKSLEITAGLGFSQPTLQRSLSGLYDDDLVRKTKIGSSKVCRYFLTDDGQRIAARLIRYQQHVLGPINCERIRPMSAPEYVPPTWGYLRNSRHVQIASRGLM